MATLQNNGRLKKELSLLNIYAIATGATLSSGFFLLPGLAADIAGPAFILSYFIAALHLFPAVLSMAELSTAMPRAGGVYYYLDRSMGPMLGTIGGIGTWLAMILKTAFALVGMSVYINLYAPDIPRVPLAIGFAILFGVINLFGAKKTSTFQIILVSTIFSILGVFLGYGSINIEPAHFSGFFDKGWNAVYATSGLVYISYVGVTKIASVSEEVQNPEKNLPRAMLLALLTAIVIYIVGTSVMVGVLTPQELNGALTPVAMAAEKLFGPIGKIMLTFAAILAFFSVANAGILSASRYPLAMSRDELFPELFSALSKHGTPKYAIYLTCLLIVAFLLLFDPTKIAKLASAFQLLLFMLSCLAVIIMRESRIEAYDPGYKSPFYPWMQIAGITGPALLIVEMGWLPVLFTVGLISLGAIWYFYYAKQRVDRGGAIYHTFARLGQRRYSGLETELRGILKEKGPRDKDPFDVVLARAHVIMDCEGKSFKEIARRAAEELARRLPVSEEVLFEGFLRGTRVGATPVANGVALPHTRLSEIDNQELVIVRSHSGLYVEKEEGEEPDEENKIHALFFLVSPEDNPGMHLRMLAQIATHAEEEDFIENWLKAETEHDLKKILLKDERFFTLDIGEEGKSADLAGRKVSQLNFPSGCLIALIYRNNEIIIPRGRTELETGDRLTVIGEPDDILKLRQRFFG